MKQPKVSIITPSYNRGHLIEETIKSVLNQTYKNIEYIIVDGMSTDNTIEILEKYKQEGKLQYISEKDDGMYYAVNKGIRIAQGDIIAYLNSDDRYFPWTVQTAVEAFQKHNKVEMIYGDSFVVDTLKNKNRLNIYPSYKKYWFSMGDTVCQPTVFLKRSVFEKVGFFNVSFQYIADCEFWQRINNTPGMNILKVDEVMAIENNHAGTIRHTMPEGIKAEKEKLMHIYGKKSSGKKIKLLMMRLYKERKLWKLIAVNLIRKIIPCKLWSNFLTAYNIKFNLLHYFLRKLYKKLPPFSITVVRGERMI